MKSTVIAYHLGKSLNIREIRLKMTYPLLKKEASFLLFGTNKSSLIYIKNYGSVVFFDCDANTISQVLNELNGSEVAPSNLYQESYEIQESDAIDIDFNTITLKEINVDSIHIIMLNLAQSVALQEFVNKTSTLHESTLQFTKQLELTGKINVSKVKMRKFIGRTLNLKNSIAEELFVFDTPELAWSTADLSKLDEHLKEELAIVKRFKGLQLSLDTIKENLDLFNDIHQHRYSSMLEWIIIILILIEVVQIFI